MQKYMKMVYEGSMIILVILTIITLWTENTYNSIINWIVWLVFFVDFVIRFITSTNKWGFIKQNPFLVLAIIPLDQFFQVARVVRLFYLFRLKTITKYYISPYIERFTYKSKVLTGLILLFILIAESVFVWTLESSITSFTIALYVTFGHLLFFGRQLLEVDNTITIWFLTITSVIGVVLQGVALQWAFSKGEVYYSKMKDSLNNRKKT